MKMRLIALAVGLMGTVGLFARTIDVAADQVVTLSEALSGTEELVKTGAGTLILGNANTGWTGAIDVQEGTLQSAYANLGTKGALRVRTGARILYTGSNVYIGSGPTRHGYLAGTVAFASGFSYANGSWYVFKDVTLEGDLTLEGYGTFVGWGTLDMGGHTVTSLTGSMNLPRLSISNFGKFIKEGGYLTFSEQSNKMIGESGSVELRDGVTCLLYGLQNCKAAFDINVTSGKCWIMSQSGSTAATTNDNVFAGAIAIAEGAELQTWAKTDGVEPVVVEGPISGAGTFATASQGNTETILRGAEPVGADVRIDINTQLTVLPERCATFRPARINIKNFRHLVFVDPTDSETLEQAAANMVIASGKTGRLYVRLTGEGENVYNGPFDVSRRLYVESPNGVVVSTAPMTSNLLNGATWANRGTWIVGNDPSGSVSLGSFYYNQHYVFRDAGDVTFTSWICSGLCTLDNTATPYRLGIHGQTRFTAKSLYAGRGGDNGLGIVEIGDGASVEGSFWVGMENNDRAAVYQNGGMVRNVSNGSDWSALGAKTSSNGAWILRGGTNEIATQLWIGYAPHAYGAYIQHGGLTYLSGSGQFRIGCGGRGVFYQDGGVFTNGAECVRVNLDGYSGLADEASFTLDGTAEFHSENKALWTWKKNALTRYNLNGGLLATPYLYLCEQDYVSGGYPNSAIHFAFNGGTLRLTGSSSSYLFGCRLDERAHPTTLTIYEGGATLDLPGGERRATMGFAVPTGLGVKSVTLPETIGGVARTDLKSPGPLKFFFEGGNGSADAMVDFDERTGTILGVKVLSSGCGYTEAPKAYVVSPNGAVTNECAVEMYEPKGGGLTKKGGARLWLDQPNTYTGPTVVEKGQIRFSAGCIPPAADITIAEGASIWPEKTATDNIIDTLRGTGIGWYDVTLTNKLVVTYADALAGKALHFKEGTITSAGAEVVLTDPEALTPRGRSVNILVADNGLVGDFAFTLPEEATGKGWKLVKAGATLRLVNELGTVFIFR